MSYDEEPKSYDEEPKSYDEEPKTILAREVKQLRNKQVLLVKVFWQHHGREEATWEPEATMRAQYPQLLESGMNFEDEIVFKGGRVVKPKLYPNSFITCLGYNKSKSIFIQNKIKIK